MVFGMESEPHSSGGSSWSYADFRMWYNLDLSFPEAATNFDVKSYLPDLLAPPVIEFEKKATSADIVWVLSNCHAFNQRESFVRKLMNAMPVDSYGACLNNNNGHSKTRMSGNIELYSKYKFVLSIENSKCEDYVSEKLVFAVASGSIPIVAGRDNKPNYAKYMPKGSYINIYDFASVSSLVRHLKKVASSKTEYEKYIRFKRGHDYSKTYLKKLPLSELIQVAKQILGNETEFFEGIVAKERSENKICKVARYLQTTPYELAEKEIKENSINRLTVAEACLRKNNLGNDF
jgi:hypothetical protein